MAWRRMFFERPGRGAQKVWAHVDDNGTPVADRGRVTIRYKVDDTREYTATEQHLTPVADRALVGVGDPDARPLSTPKPSTSPKKKRTSSKPKPPPDAVFDTAWDNVKVVPNPSTIPDSPAEGTILIFTDGACFGNPGPAGLGAVIMYGDHQKEISEFIAERGTNNIGELMAIQRALEAIKNPQLPVHLYTDSTYSLGVLARGWKASANREIIDTTQALFPRFADLTLFKVKGHAGHAGNELADTLAVGAIENAGFDEDKFGVGNAGPKAAKTAAGPAKIAVEDNPSSIPETPPPGVTLLFTDGACFGNPGPSALGVVMLTGEEQRELGEYLGHGTNNIAELTAIQRALDMSVHEPGQIQLYTDSSYAIGVLAKGWKAKANQELIADIKSRLTDFDGRLTLLKVKGHAGHRWNERVDVLAKEAITDQE